jgi:basic amino acid/polyamine antiporter, APA family
MHGQRAMSWRGTGSAAVPGAGLHRSLGVGLLVLYGLGVIIGAGVYVVIGDVVAHAGALAAWSFAMAGALAGLTALAYAELAARYPEAAGAAAYVKEAFGSDRFSQLTGGVVAVVVLISTATIARGTAGYAHAFVALPEPMIAAGVVLGFTVVACLGVKDSVRVAAVMTVIELAGLLLVISTGLTVVRDLPLPALTWMPIGLEDWRRVGAGAFLAFFAFTGFENLANMAEEATNAGRTLPRAMLLSLGISTLIYVTVALVVVAVVPLEDAASSEAPLLSVIERRGWGLSEVFAALALVAVSNGVLIQLLMLARLVYGMARRALLPSGLVALSSRQVPVRATLVAGALVLLSTVILPFHALLRLSTTLTLLVFVLVSLSLWRLQPRAPRPDLAFHVPRWVPIAATLGNLGLIAAQWVLA